MGVYFKNPIPIHTGHCIFCFCCISFDIFLLVFGVFIIIYGIIIVFAAGNDNKDIGNDESAIPEVISVSTTDEYNERATTYSNYGPNLNLLAPGGYEFGIITIDDMNNKGKASINKNYILYNNHNCFAGTSDAAPIVIGVIALMLEKNPNLTREEVENILKQSCDKIGNIEYKNGRNDYYGYGKINLTKIMRKIK